MDEFESVCAFVKRKRIHNSATEGFRCRVAVGICRRGIPVPCHRGNLPLRDSGVVPPWESATAGICLRVAAAAENNANADDRAGFMWYHESGWAFGGWGRSAENGAPTDGVLNPARGRERNYTLLCRDTVEMFMWYHESWGGRAAVEDGSAENGAQIDGALNPGKGAVLHAAVP